MTARWTYMGTWSILSKYVYVKIVMLPYPKLESYCVSSLKFWQPFTMNFYLFTELLLGGEGRGGKKEHIIATPFSIISENSWRIGNIPEVWRRTTVIFSIKKDRRKQRNYRPINLISIIGKVFDYQNYQTACLRTLWWACCS